MVNDFVQSSGKKLKYANNFLKIRQLGKRNCFSHDRLSARSMVVSCGRRIFLIKRVGKNVG